MGGAIKGGRRTRNRGEKATQTKNEDKLGGEEEGEPIPVAESPV